MKNLLLVLLFVCFAGQETNNENRSLARTVKSYWQAETADEHFVNGKYSEGTIDNAYFEESLGVKDHAILITGIRVNESFAVSIMTERGEKPQLTEEESELVLEWVRQNTSKARIFHYEQLRRKIEDK